MASLTPAAWLSLLERQLAEQQSVIQLPDDYYDGRHRMAFATAKFRQTFGALFKALADNWCPTVVDAAVDRLTIWGFRFGDTEDADTKAWDIWQANNLDAESIVAHTEAGKLGVSYVMVAPPLGDEKYPRITVEHPSQVTVAHAPGDVRQRVAALKKWQDDDGYTYANVYLPEAIYKFRSKEKRAGILAGDEGRNMVQVPGGGTNPLGVVPIIPLYNKRKMLGGGVSDLATAIPLQDAINKELADMLVASEFAAFPQRVLTGVEVPTDENGAPTSATELKAAVGRLWAFENENAKVSEFQAADLNNYVQAITLLLQHLSAQTRTPPHYLLGEIVNVSGDALVAAETGLTKRVERKHTDFSDPWEEAIRLAFKAMDEKAKSQDLNAETIWRPAEMRNEAQVWDAATKMKTVGVPQVAIWEYAGFTPKQIARFKKLKEEEPAPPDPSSMPPTPEMPLASQGTTAPRFPSSPARGAAQAEGDQSR